MINVSKYCQKSAIAVPDLRLGELYFKTINTTQYALENEIKNQKETKKGVNLPKCVVGKFPSYFRNFTFSGNNGCNILYDKSISSTFSREIGFLFTWMKSLQNRISEAIRASQPKLHIKAPEIEQNTRGYNTLIY